MSRIWTGTGRNLLLLAAALVLPFAGVFVVELTSGSLGRTPRLAIMFATIIPVFWLVTRYWRGLDEAAQEAQKSAWFWGGSLGTVAGVFAITFLPLDLVARLPGQSPRDFMMHGATFVAIGAVTGFLLAWALWWWRRR